MASALQNFITEPVRHRRFDLAWYRISQLLHERTNGSFDAAYMQVARVLRPKVTLPVPKDMSEAKVAGVVERLRRDGYMIFPDRLPAKDLEEITSFAFSTPAISADMRRTIPVTRDSIPKGEPRLYWWMSDLARLPAIQRMITDGPYCAIAQDYLGCRPKLAHISLLLDVPLAGKYDAYTYHYDNEGPGFLKFFIFLTDVDIGTGSHYFIAGSHAHKKPDPFTRATMYETEPLLKLYGSEKEIIVRGPAGTILAEDTAGFHRGSIIERNYRLLVQIEFSAIEVPTDQELFRPLEPAPVPGLHPGLAAIVGKCFAPA